MNQEGTEPVVRLRPTPQILTTVLRGYELHWRRRFALHVWRLSYMQNGTWITQAGTLSLYSISQLKIPLNNCKFMICIIVHLRM